MSENNDYSGLIASFIGCFLLGIPVMINLGFFKGLILIFIISIIIYCAFMSD